MKKPNLKFKIQKFHFLLLILGFFLLPLAAKGAIIYLSPSSGSYYQGDIFLVEIRIDTEEECINAVEADLSFSQDILEGIDFSQGNSILTLWAKSPTIDQTLGLISFIGGMPGGYCGGDNLLGRVVFRTKEIEKEKEGKLEFLEETKVLLHDEFGTLAELTTKEATFKVLSEKLESPKNEWQEELGKDNIPPEPFQIEISQTPTVFEGKYFIAFSAIDKQTGIDHYGVKEGKKDFKEATSPYLLEDQSLKSKILVKAVDKAGNERIEEITLPHEVAWKDIIIPLLILIGIFGGWWFIKKLKRKYKNHSSLRSSEP